MCDSDGGDHKPAEKWPCDHDSNHVCIFKLNTPGPARLNAIYITDIEVPEGEEASRVLLLAASQ